MKEKPYYLAMVSFIFSLIAILPLPFLLISNFIEISSLLNIIMGIASLSIFFSLIVGSYAYYKIKKENLSGIIYAKISIIIPFLLIIALIIRLIFF